MGQELSQCIYAWMVSVMSADATEYRVRVPLGGGPNANRMSRQGVVTIFAGIKYAAAFHLDGDDVHRQMVVSAARLGIDVDSANVYWDFFLRLRLVWLIH